MRWIEWRGDEGEQDTILAGTRARKVHKLWYLVVPGINVAGAIRLAGSFAGSPVVKLAKQDKSFVVNRAVRYIVGAVVLHPA